MQENTSDYIYKLNSDNKSLTLVKAPKTFATEIIIPKYHDYLPITKIGSYAFSNFEHVEKIIIPDTVIEIGDYAFEQCMDLTSIVIPPSVTVIGDCAFSCCTYLWDFEIPESVESIGYRAFFYCTMISHIHIPDSVKQIGAEAFMYCTDLREISVSPQNPKYASIDGNLVSKNHEELIQYAIGRKDISYTIPEKIKVIGHGAFYQSNYLKKIDIPSNITEIRDIAFLHCKVLKSICFYDDNKWKVFKGYYSDDYETIAVNNDKKNVEYFGKTYHFHCWLKDV